MSKIVYILRAACLAALFSLFLWYFYVESREPNRNTSRELEKAYEYHATDPGNQALPLLRDLAKKCSSATEIGAQPIVSTWGILQGLSESEQNNLKYIGIDPQLPPPSCLNSVKQIATDNGIDFTFWRANYLEIEIEPTDLLVIESWLTYNLLKSEFEHFASNVKKYIVILGRYESAPLPYKKTKNGEAPFIGEFLKRHPEWRIDQEYSLSDGMTVFERKVPYAKPEPVYHPDIDTALKNRIVLCTGPARGRRDLLLQATESDMSWIPFKKIVVVTNDPAIMDITFKGQEPLRELIADEGKQLDCINTIILSIKNAINDPEVTDDDIILFKHESVYINDMDLLKKAISKILDGYDMIVRLNETPWYQGARGTDAFFVRVSAIKDLIKNMPKVTAYRHSGDCCEKYFTDHLVKPLQKIYNVPYYHSNGGFTELGFYHLFSPYTLHDPHWNRRNRDTLFLLP